MAYGFSIIVSGPWACFTRPEMKVERVSYDVPTPGALVGLIKGVYWKPAIEYVIDKIVVCNPIRFVNIRRNEVKDKVKGFAIKDLMNGKQADPTIYAADSRTQKASMILRDVKYGIQFHFQMTGLRSDKSDESPEKHFSMLKRRLERGQYFRKPCLGCSEFPVKDMAIVDDLQSLEISSENKGDIDLGYMLYGMKFKNGGHPVNDDWEHPVFSDKADPVFYRPHMVDGVIDVAKYRENSKC